MTSPHRHFYLFLPLLYSGVTEVPNLLHFVQKEFSKIELQLVFNIFYYVFQGSKRTGDKVDDLQRSLKEMTNRLSTSEENLLELTSKFDIKDKELLEVRRVFFVFNKKLFCWICDCFSLYVNTKINQNSPKSLLPTTARIFTHKCHALKL